jgi:hypothetical protein
MVFDGIAECCKTMLEEDREKYGCSEPEPESESEPEPESEPESEPEPESVSE